MIALACDHGGFRLMREIMAFLDAKGLTYKEFGTFSTESCDYPEYAVPAAHSILNGECNCGIFICGTGIGMSIAANKVPGIRAAICTDCYMAEMTRRHNDANVLVLGERVIGVGLACKIVNEFLNTSFDTDGRHAYRIAMLNELDKKRTSVS